MTTRAAIDLFNLTVPGAVRPTTAPPPRPPVVGPVPPAPRPPVAPPRPPVPLQPPEAKTHQRPPYAAEIDALVAEMVADGLVTLDLETDTYRSTRRRAWRFEQEVET